MRNGGKSKTGVKPKRKPSELEKIKKAKTVDVLTFEMLKEKKPRTRIERIMCALSPHHPLQFDELSDLDRKRFTQYKFLYKSLLDLETQKEMEGEKLDHVATLQQNVCEEFGIPREQYWRILGEAKTLFNYDPDFDRRAKKRAYIEEYRGLLEEAKQAWRDDKSFKFGNITALLKEIRLLDMAEEEKGLDMERILEELRLPTQLILTNNNSSRDMDIEEAEILEETKNGRTD